MAKFCGVGLAGTNVVFGLHEWLLFFKISKTGWEWFQKLRKFDGPRPRWLLGYLPTPCTASEWEGTVK